MHKLEKYTSNSLLVIAGLCILVGLFTDISFSWVYVWLFLAPSLIIHEAIQMPSKGKKRIYSIVYISAISLIFGIAVLELIIG